MRRFGDAESFLELLQRVRRLEPLAGVRSNVIVGFPGETEADLETLCGFLTEARLDVTGVFGYSDEDGTEAAGFADKLDEVEIAARTDHVSRLVEELTSQRAEERIGETVHVLVESVGEEIEGRAAHQGPEVDGNTVLIPAAESGREFRIGELVTATVRASQGVDLTAEATGVGR